MTEYNIFCWSKEHNDENSFQQKRYRIFNTEISKEEYQKIVVPKIKLEFDKDLSYDVRYKKARKDAWNKLSQKEKEQFTNLQHFNPEIFEEITGIKIDEEITEMTLADICKELGKNIKVIK